MRVRNLADPKAFSSRSYNSCLQSFSIEGWIWVLIASIPGFCILFTFIHHEYINDKMQLTELYRFGTGKYYLSSQILMKNVIITESQNIVLARSLDE